MKANKWKNKLFKRVDGKVERDKYTINMMFKRELKSQNGFSYSSPSFNFFFQSIKKHIVSFIEWEKKKVLGDIILIYKYKYRYRYRFKYYNITYNLSFI